MRWNCSGIMFEFGFGVTPRGRGLVRPFAHFAEALNINNDLRTGWGKGKNKFFGARDKLQCTCLRRRAIVLIREELAAVFRILIRQGLGFPKEIL